MAQLKTPSGLPDGVWVSSEECPYFVLSDPIRIP